MALLGSKAHTIYTMKLTIAIFLMLLTAALPARAYAETLTSEQEKREGQVYTEYKLNKNLGIEMGAKKNPNELPEPNMLALSLTFNFN